MDEKRIWDINRTAEREREWIEEGTNERLMLWGGLVGRSTLHYMNIVLNTPFAN